MRKEVAVFAAAILLTALAAQYLPGILHLPAGLVQERMLLALLPALLVLAWWTR